MTIPDVDISFKNGGLGIVPPGAKLFAFLGLCSVAADNSVNLITDKGQIASVLGYGMLARAASYHVGTTGQPILAIPVNKSVNATYSSVVKTGTGSASLAVAGTSALDDAEILVEITRNAATLVAATAAMIISLDNGDTYRSEVAVPVSGIYEIPNTGITITFTDGAPPSFVEGTVYAFAVTAASFALVDVNAALAGLLADSRVGRVEFAHLIGAADSVIAAGMEATLLAAETPHKYIYGLINTRSQLPDTIADFADEITDDFDGLNTTRIGVGAGDVEIIDPLTSQVRRAPVSWPYAARLASITLATNPMQFDGGELQGVQALFYDENVSGLLDSERFVTARTFDGETGFWITNGNMLTAPGSDFSDVTRRRVIDAVARALRAALLRLVLGKKIQVDKVTGLIDEATAKGLDLSIAASVDAGLSAEYVSLSIQVSRTENILSTNLLPVKAEILPFGYAKTITVEVGFVNPALNPV